MINNDIDTIKNNTTFPKILQLNSIVWKELIIMAGKAINNNIAETVFACAGSAFPLLIKIKGGTI